MLECRDYKPGLSLLLVEKKQYSFLNGLNVKYPLAWKKRLENPYCEAKVFSSSTLEKEYYCKLAYALFEYSEVNEALKKELSSKVMSLFPKYNRHRNKFIEDGKFILDDYCAGFILSEILGVLTCVVAQNNLYTLILTSVGLFFAEQEGMELESRATVLIDKVSNTFFNEWVKVKKLVSGGNTLSVKEAKDFKSNIKQNVKGVITAYNNLTGANVYKDLPEMLSVLQPNMLEEDAKSAIYYEMSRWFNQDLFLLVHEYKLTSGDIEQIFYNIIQSWTHEEVKWQDVTSIPEHVLLEIDELLVYSAIIYICMKTADESRDFYWRDTKGENSNDTLIHTLQTEIDKLEKEKERLTIAVKKHSQEIQDCRMKSGQAISNAIKETKDELNAVKREKRNQELEIQALKKYIQELENELLIEDEEEEVLQERPVEELVELLNHPNILICPGHQNLLNKMKEILPNVKILEIDRTYQASFFNGVTHVFINKKYFNHAKYYKIKTSVPDAKLHRITRTKIELVLSEMANALAI